MPNWKLVVTSGSDASLNSLIVTNGITGSLFGTASYADNATSASYAATALSSSYASTATSASYSLTATSASYSNNSTSASYATTATSASYAATASYVVLAQTASYVLNAVSASYSNNATSASYTLTASYVQTAQTASYVLNAVSASYSATALSSSYASTATSASYSLTATSASYSNNSTSASYALTATSASYASTALSSSYAVSASYATTALSSSYASTATSASYSSNSTSASYATTATSASYATTALSSSYAVSASYAPSSLSGGTSNYLVKWTGATTVGTSVIQDDGTNIGIGIAPNGTDKIYVSGSGKFSSHLLVDNGLRIWNGAGSVLTNVAIGAGALGNNTTGTANIAIGYQSLNSNTVESSNTVIGYQSGFSGTGARANSYLGYQTFKSNVNGDFNVGMGYHAGLNATGTANTFMGWYAGYSVVGFSGNYNTAIGNSAGFNMTSGASSNTYIGPAAGFNMTTGNNNVIIGGYPGTGFETTSNGVWLSDGAGNARVRIPSTGNVLINTTTDAGYKLDVNGNSRVSGVMYQTNTTGIILRPSSGILRDVYIGPQNTEPTTSNYRTIIGNSNFYNTSYGAQQVVGYYNRCDEVSNGSLVLFGISNRVINGDYSNGLIGFSNTIDYTPATTSRNLVTVGGGNKISHRYSAAFGSYQYTTAEYELCLGNYQTNHNAGFRNVYIGGQGSRAGGDTGRTAFTPEPTTWNFGGAAYGTDKEGADGRIAASKSTGAATSKDLLFATATPVTSSDTLQSLTDRMVIKGGSGYVGIGTSSPTSTLHISGSTGYNQLRLESKYTPSSTADANGSVGDFAYDDTYLYLKTSTGWGRVVLDYVF